jgi:hypothetical protein
MMALLEEKLQNVNREIARTEMRSAARAAVLIVLLKTGYDTADLERRLWDDMDALDGLRRQRWAIRDTLIEADPAASAEQLLGLFDEHLRLILGTRQPLQDLEDQ